MNVIGDTANAQGFHFIALQNTPYEGPETSLQFRCNNGLTSSRAENAVDRQGIVRVGHFALLRIRSSLLD